MQHLIGALTLFFCIKDNQPGHIIGSKWIRTYFRLILLLFRTSCPFSVLTRPRISGKRASRGYALRLYSLPRDDKRRSGSLPQSHLILVFPWEEASGGGCAQQGQDGNKKIRRHGERNNCARAFDFASWTSLSFAQIDRSGTRHKSVWCLSWVPSSKRDENWEPKENKRAIAL